MAQVQRVRLENLCSAGVPRAAGWALGVPLLATALALRISPALLEDIQGIQAFVQVGRLQGNLLEIFDIHWISLVVAGWNLLQVECFVQLRSAFLVWRGLVVQTQSLVEALGGILIDEDDL